MKSTLRRFLAALPVLACCFSLGASLPDHPGRHREECTPERTVVPLRAQVVFSAGDSLPVALGAEFTVNEPSLLHEDAVAWRLVVTTLDREVVDERSGLLRLLDGTGIATVTFDGHDAEGNALPPGEYVYRFEADEFEGSGAFLTVVAEGAEPPVLADDTAAPLATSLNASVPYSFYFGSQHAHTIYSDGGIPVASCSGSVSSPHTGANPTQAYAYAKASGNVDWICVIEHNHLVDDACGTSCTAATIKGRYQEGLSAAAAATTSTFVGLYGMEYGVIGDSSTKQGHLALYDVTKLMSWETTYADVVSSKTDYASVYAQSNSAANQGTYGAVGSFCHPKTYNYSSWAQNADGLAFMRGLAVISGPANSNATNFADGGSRYAGPAAGTDMYQWALQRGWKIGPEAHQDNHCFNYGNATRNRTVALATSLSKASLMDALKSRRFYASSDLNAQMFFGTADYGRVMGEIFTTSSSTLNLLLWINDPDGATVSTVNLYQGNPAAGSGAPTTLTMAAAGSGTYTATVTVPATGQAYWYAYAKLSSGAEFWSAPIWVTRSGGCSDTTAPSATITAPSGTTVSGTVTVSATATDNVGVTGMTLRIDGATVATSTSGSVSYSWNTSGLAGGSSHSITATATDACGNTSPTASKSVSIASTVTYSISGNAGTTGATVATAGASTTSDASSNYTLSGLANGTYTVTPTKSGCTFSPTSLSVTIAGANVTGKSFTATCGSGDTPLTSGVALSGQTVALNAWKYYYITVPSGATNLTFATTGATADVDIYSRATSKPTSSTYTCRPYEGDGNETCSHTNPAAGTWWLGVHGYQAATFTVTATVTTTPGSYTISGNAGTSGATLSTTGKTATSDASGNYTFTGMASGTYIITPSKSGCTFSPVNKSVTISSANVTGIGFTATCGGGTTLFSNGFETTSVWNNAVVVSGSTNGAWSMASSGTNPSVTPHGGSSLAKFNSYNASSGAQTRYYRSSGFSVASTWTTVTLTFWMYHDTGYSSSADRVQPQLSTNGGSTWVNVGSAVNRYDGSTGWKKHSVSITTYKGSTVTLGFLGVSAYGNNVFLDDIAVTAQ